MRLPFFNSSDFTPEWIDKSEENSAALHHIAPFSFINQDGKTVTNTDYLGKIYVANFFFTTCPGICPQLTQNMLHLQDVFKEDDSVALLSHTVMPWVDTVDKLKAYALQNEINSNKWNLVTGTRKDIYAIARESYFSDEDFIKTQEESDFIHTENFILVDKKGRIRGVYNGTLSLETERLIKHISILNNEN